MKRFEWWILGVVLLAGFVVRLYRFDNPIADWHSWRQADTSAVSRNFVENGYDVLHPKFEDISNIPSGVENPQGYRFVEFPIYNVAQAGLYQLFPIFSLEEWGRLVTIFASLSISVFLYLIVRKHLNATAGFFTAFFYTFVPYSIYYGRTILPDTSMAAAILAGIYFFDRWIEKSEILNSKSKISTSKNKWKMINGKWQMFALSIFFTATALLLKPYALFFTLPMIYLAWQKFGFNLFKKWQLWVFLIISVIPLALWRGWITQYPEGIPASTWLFNGNGIRFRPSFFRWILYDRFTRLISGYFGTLLVAFAFFKMKNIKKYGFFYSFLVASILYVCIIATGNVQHDYYQILIMPTLAVFYGLGAYFLFTHSDKPFHVNIYKLTLVIITIGMFVIGWNYIKDYFNINNPSIVVAGQAVDRLTPKNSLIIAPYDGDTSFLYQTKRQGWPSFEHDIKQLVTMGANYLVLVNPKVFDYQGFKDYKIIASTPQYVLFKLK